MSPQRATQEMPQTTIGLLKLVITSAFKNLPKMILGLVIRGALSFALVFALNFYIVAIKNEGVGISLPANNPWYPLLNLGTNQAAFSAICFFAFFILSTLWGRIRSHGLLTFLKEIAGVPGWTIQSARQTSQQTLPILAISGGLLMFSSLLIHNRYLYATFAIGLFLAYAARESDFSVVFCLTLWSDLRRLFRRSAPQRTAPAGVIAMAMLGLLLSSILLIYLPKQPVLPVILGVAFIVVGILLARRKISPQTAVFLLGLAVFATLVNECSVQVLADDGGWQEGGSNVGSYMRSPGASAVLQTGVKPGLLGLAGSLLGGIFSSGLNVVKGAASTAYNTGKYVGGKIVDGASYVAETAVNVGHEAIKIGRDMLDPAIIKDTVINIKNELVDTARQIKDGVVQIAGDIKQAAVDVYHDPQILVDTIKGTAGDIKDGVVTAVTETAQAVKDIYNDPQILVDTLKGSAETVKNIAVNAGTAIYTTITDPRKAWEFVKDAVGIKDFIDSWDPNKPLISRIGSVLTGTIKLGSTIATVGQAGTIVKSGVKSVGGLVDDLLGSAGTKKIASSGTHKVLTTAPGRIPGSQITKYTPTGKPVNLGGITNKSKIAIQNVADDMGVQIHTRPVNGPAKTLLEKGQALPKPPEIKVKTLNKWDDFIGGPKNQEGKAAIFKPEAPSKQVWNQLSNDQKKEVLSRYQQRHREYRKYIGEINSNPNVRVDGKIIIDKATGKSFTADVDIYDITNFDGSPVPEHVKQMAIKRLESIGPANVKHGNLTSWTTADPHFDEKGFIKMINDGKNASKVDGGVISFNPLGNPVHNVANGPLITSIH